ncbi:L-rhamnose mutarotase [Actinotignum schaalii]|uniref:L-rhamnose mutarotase n=1 Tax=Actinotignum schaalii TaxID=59505 RepID=UPI00373EEE29
MVSTPTVDQNLNDTTQKSDSRCGFVLRVREDKLDEYLQAHCHVWEEMRDALSRSGWRNYSLFVDPETAVVFGYFEADDVWQAMNCMENEEINTKWQAEMAQYFVQPDGGTNYFLSQYFYLQ